MAPPSMFWRYLTLTLLLGVPSGRIFPSAAYNSLSADEQGQSQPNSNPLIDDIIQHIQRQQLDEGLRQSEGAGKQAGIRTEQRVLDSLSGGNNKAQDGISKKDEVNLQQESGQTAGSSKSSSKDQPPQEEGAAKDAGNGEEQQQQQQGEGTGSNGGEGYAAPGRFEAHSSGQRTDDEGDEHKSHVLSSTDTEFAVVVAAAVATSFVGLMMAGICYYKFRKNAKAASDVEYPAYGVTGPMKEKVPSPGDRKLAQSAQMYHYQHQKQQMIAMEKANGDMKHDASDDDSEEDNVEGDYTVYECPGLAPTGEMEVINPLFRGGEEKQASTETPSAPAEPTQEDK